MDDSTKTWITTLAVGGVQKVLMIGGSALAAHGFSYMGTNTELYAGLATAIVAAGVSFWRDYGRAIITSQLEVLKAKSLASAKKIQDAGLTSITPTEIADQSPKLTTASVIKIAETLPQDVKASVIPVAFEKAKS